MATTAVYVLTARRDMAAWTCLQVPASHTEDYKKRAQNMPGPAKGMDVDCMNCFIEMLMCGVPAGYDPEKDCRKTSNWNSTYRIPQLTNDQIEEALWWIQLIKSVVLELV